MGLYVFTLAVCAGPWLLAMATHLPNPTWSRVAAVTYSKLYTAVPLLFPPWSESWHQSAQSLAAPPWRKHLRAMYWRQLSNSQQHALLVGHVVYVALLGSIWGSFLNVVIYRAPRGMSLVVPPSSCPTCGNTIRARDNLPVLGWILLGGKCRYCKSKISVQYPLVELFVGIFCAMIWCKNSLWINPATPDYRMLARELPFFSCLLIQGLAEREQQIVPRYIYYWGGALALLLQTVAALPPPLPWLGLTLILPVGPMLDSLLGVILGLLLAGLWMRATAAFAPGYLSVPTELYFVAGATWGVQGSVLVFFLAILHLVPTLLLRGFISYAPPAFSCFLGISYLTLVFMGT